MLGNAHVSHKETGNTIPQASFEELLEKGLLNHKEIDLTPPPRPPGTLLCVSQEDISFESMKTWVRIAKG